MHYPSMTNATTLSTKPLMYRVIVWVDEETAAKHLVPDFPHARDFATLEEAMRDADAAEREGCGPQSIRCL